VGVTSFGVVLYHDQDPYHPFLFHRFVGQGLLQDTLFPIFPQSAHNQLRVQVDNISTPYGTLACAAYTLSPRSYPTVVSYVLFLGVVHYSLAVDSDCVVIIASCSRWELFLESDLWESHSQPQAKNVRVSPSSNCYGARIEIGSAQNHKGWIFDVQGSVVQRDLARSIFLQL
jgi:hypothetical protein